MIEREPITVILSQRGWIRAMKGHVALDQAETLKFKEGDGPLFAFHAQTTDKLLLATDNGRFYTLGADRLPGGRGFGEPVRLMVDVEGESGSSRCCRCSRRRGCCWPHRTGAASSRRPARSSPRRARAARWSICAPTPSCASCGRSRGDEDYVAIIGDNRKLVVFPIDELPEMARGQGVQLQKYRDGGMADAITFRFDRGLSWAMGGESGRTRTEADLTPWRVARGATGRMPPVGFPRDNRFKD